MFQTERRHNPNVPGVASPSSPVVGKHISVPTYFTRVFNITGGKDQMDSMVLQQTCQWGQIRF